MAHDYSSEATQRCERVLGTLMRGIGQPWRHKVCLVGGLVPLYLVDGNNYALPAHVGSAYVRFVTEPAPRVVEHFEVGSTWTRS